MLIGDTTIDQPIEIPEALRALAARWRAGDRPEPPRWDRAAWRTRFPRHGDLIDALPDRVRLADAVRVTDTGLARGDVDSAERAYVAAMIWGYASSGYGPFRSGRVLDGGADVARRLGEIARVAAVDGAVAAVDMIAMRPLRHLGVAFGTRFVRVCTPEVATAPVLDSAVARWFADHCGVRLRVDAWRRDEYRVYADTVAGWTVQLGLGATVVEELIMRAPGERSGVPGPARGGRGGPRSDGRRGRRWSPDVARPVVPVTAPPDAPRRSGGTAITGVAWRS